MTAPKKRVALKPHAGRIKEWVRASKTDEWIADALGTSPSSVQSFRSRNGIHRSGPGEPESVFEGTLDHGERDGWGLWLDPAILEDPIWREHWAGVESVTVKVAEDSVVLEAVGDVPGSTGQQPRAIAESSGGEPVRAPDPERKGWPKAENNTALFLSRRGGRLSTRAVDLIVRKLGEEANLDRPLSAHALRHTSVTNLVRAGADLVLVAEIAGHRRLETTRRYSLPSAADREAAIEGIRVEY